MLAIRYTVLPRVAEFILSLQSRQDAHVTIPGPRVVVVVPEEVVVVELVEVVDPEVVVVVEPAVVVVVELAVVVVVEPAVVVVVEPVVVVVVDVMGHEYLQPVTPASFHPLDFVHVLESPVFAFER